MEPLLCHGAGFQFLVSNGLRLELFDLFPLGRLLVS